MNSKNSPILATVAVLLISASTIIDAAAILECPPHSTFNGCMSRCPKTCQNIDLPPTNCISACSVGCECLEGFVKVAKGATAQCVKAYECPMYSKQSTLPYPVLRKLAAAASVPANQAVLSLNLTTLAGLAGSTGTSAGTGSTGSGSRPTTAAAAMAMLGRSSTSAAGGSASASVSSTIAVLRKVKTVARPEENESHED